MGTCRLFKVWSSLQILVKIRRENILKIRILSKEGYGFSSVKAALSVKGDKALIIPLLERALEIARQSRYDTEIREILEQKSNK
jgi:hypothetical protein